eukprot:TRINITY_DN5361_c0_g1_i1.p1 TRINITY_DN5361_c0_g1~~TRINITY_DN5361_c0_g1_i1.p1  ORF type:complete len:367 (+),score=96.68 TRINITY_DN5361_c0_g1_i1:48-1103(+)
MQRVGVRSVCQHLGEEIRKLGAVEVISEIKPHENADRLEVAVIRGWETVVGKGDFIEGDKVVFLEVDAIIPEAVLEGRKELEPMRKNKFRVKTIRLRGVISQGLCLPCDILPERPEGYPEGTDVTEILGLTKHEVIDDNMKFPGSRQLGNFPETVPKTDLKRVQNITKVIPKLVGRAFCVTEKVDGASVTVLKEKGVVKVCSKNIMVSEESKYGVAVKRLGIEEKLAEMGLDDIALQGELVGPTVSGNRYRLKHLTIYFFSVYNPTTESYLTTHEAISLIKSLDLQWVPIVHPSYALPTCSYSDLVSMASGDSTLGTNMREGLVFQADPQDGYPRFAFKAISNDYLLKYSL